MFKRHIASFILAALLAIHALAATIIREATANQSPDATLGGLAVTTPSNTGHASTLTSASAGATQTKSCRWHTFQTVAGQIKSITLKIDHTTSGSLAGPTPANTFSLEYSLNNGTNWTVAASRTNFTTSEGPTTFSASLSAGQDIAQVQVRVLYQSSTTDAADSATVTATIANIKLEVVTVDAQVIVMM